MKRELSKLKNIRSRFVGTFERYGKKSAYRGPDKTTILLKNIVFLETGETVADHVWLNETVDLAKLYPLKAGDVLSFDARVTMYEKGYKGNRWDVLDKPVEKDYRLSYPTKFEIIQPA